MWKVSSDDLLKTGIISVFLFLSMRIIGLLLVFLSTTAFSQTVLNPYGEILEGLPFFNKDVIKQFNVKSIRGHYATKFDMDVIRPNSDAYVYEFDRLGQLVREYKIHMGDTLISSFQYDYKGNITLHRESNKFGYYEKRYSFDDRNRVTKLELRRDKKSHFNKLSFELDESKIVSEESFEYIALEGLNYKKLCYNSSNRVYRIEFYYFNEKGQLIKKESALHNGSGRVEVNYKYSFKGMVEEVVTVGVGSGRHEKTKKFEYDKLGNVLSRKVFRNAKIISEEQFVFFERTGLLKAIISRGAAGNMLTILQFSKYTNFN